ncbi:MAG: HD domain-containing protein [Sedimentisphaerales bacterium]|nr:HD domain-containing protein [Sedimentisphaerales bacterium]
MLRVSVSELRPGMVLAQSIPNPQKLEYTLLKSGYELEEESIKRLRSLGVPGAWVKYPNLDFLDTKIDTGLITKHQELYGSLKEQFSETQEWNFGKLDYKTYMSQIQELFEHILSSRGTTASFIEDLHSHGADVFRHGMVTASLAMLVGMRLEAYLVKERPQLPAHLATDLTSLGLGCLLHDIGKLLFEPELRSFRLTAHDRGTPEWQSHTEVALEMMKGSMDRTAGQVVLNHHQHYDGSGFPARRCLPGKEVPTETLSGSDIHVFCRIATVVDRFDSFRYLPDGRVAPLIVALKRMKNTGYIKWFDPTVYHAFIQTTPAFVLGEQVVLNDGRNCVVVEHNLDEPCKPIVRPIDTSLAVRGAAVESGEPTGAEQPDINLAKRTDLHVAKVGDFDVTPYLH